MLTKRAFPSLMMSAGAILMVVANLTEQVTNDAGGLLLVAVLALAVTFVLVGMVVAFARRASVTPSEDERALAEARMQATASVMIALAVTVNSVRHFTGTEASSTVAGVLLVAAPVLTWVGAGALIGLLRRLRRLQQLDATTA